MTDRPWGMTLGAIASRHHTGQLTIESDGKRYCIAFSDGAIVGATSPLAADAIARIALTNHFITSTQVADITRRIALAPERDEVDVLAEAIRCSAEQILKLRRRLVAQRAARTFSLEHGEFVLDDRIALPVFADVAIDHRHAIYLGVRTNLSEQRLIDDLRQLGAFFVLKPETVDELPRYGFEPGAHPVIEALKLGTSLPELEASHRELDPRFAQAIIYALVSCTACTISPRAATAQPSRARTATPPRDRGVARTTTRPAAPSIPRSTTPPRADRRTTTSSPFASRTSTKSPTAYSGGAPADAGTNTPAATRPRSASDPGATRTATGVAAPVAGRTQTPPAPATGRTRTPVPTAGQAPTASPSGRAQTSPPATEPPPARPPTSPTELAAAPSVGRSDTEESVKFNDTPTPSPLPPLARTAVTFGEAQPTRAGASTAAPTARGAAPRAAQGTQSPRPAVPRAPTPGDADALRGFADQRTPSGFLEQRTPSGFLEQRTPGFSDQRTPSEQRTPTDQGFSRTPTGGPAPSTENAAAAEAAFKRGEQAMKRDQPGEAILEYKAACDLDPNEVDYAGMLAWAKFCAAGDKAAIGADTRKLLERAVFKSQRPERARFYLGRVERMLGRDKEALRHFQEVLELKPNHAEAASEVRAIEARLQAGKGGTGLFGRKR